MGGELWLLWSLLHLGTVQGSVWDARTGEPLSRVRVELVGANRHAQTDHEGRFQIAGVPAGGHELRLSTVGYRLLQKHFELRPDEVQEFRLALSPDSYQRTDSATVRVDAFQLDGDSGATAIAIDGSEIKNLASVLIDDPLRAVQSMPGVTSDDDFDARFSLHGASYRRIGLYLDEVLMHQPFHTVQGEGPSGSLAVFNGDMVQNLKLEIEGYGPQYGNRTAGILDVRTRDGSRTQTNLRAAVGAANAGLMAEGPLGSGQRGSWLASVRKSYLEYVLQRTSSDLTMAFGFLNSQVRVNYDIGQNQNLMLEVIDGASKLDRSHWRDRLGLNAAMLAGYRFTMSNLGWQYSPGPRFVWSSHAAFIRERYDNTNTYGQQLGEGYYGEWAGNSNATWMWSQVGTLNFGVSMRKMRGSGFADYYHDTSSVRVREHAGGTWLAGGYAQESFSALGKRLFLTGGVRWDRLGSTGVAVTSPQASLAFLPWRSGKFHVSWGRYAQFPDIQELYDNTIGSPRLAPERATHYVAAFEQRLGGQTRLRVEAYRRDDRDLLFQPLLEARLAGGVILPHRFDSPIMNSLSGSSRGFEVFLQRRTANRLTGWISYAYGYARVRDALTGIRFFADQDQRHTVNTYVGYRLRPSVNLSTKVTYGSGMPVPGFFSAQGDTFYLSSERNATRLGPYERVDFRINKERTFDRWKMTIYTEVVNLFNAANYRFDSYDGFDRVTGRAYISLTKMFPILPSAGVMLEW